jgi:hypothetical protein
VTGLRAAGISPDRCERQDEGDGCQLITLPSGIDPAVSVPTLLRALSLAAGQVKATSANVPEDKQEWVPLRVSVTYGSVQLASDRFVGPAASAARDMLTAHAQLPTLRHTGQLAVAVMITDDLYLLLAARTARGFDPAQFLPVSLPISGTPYRYQCWRYTSADALDKAQTVVLSGAPSANSRSLALDSVIPLAAMGTSLWWDLSHHGHQHDAVQGWHHDPVGEEHHSEYRGADQYSHHDSWSQDAVLGDPGSGSQGWDDPGSHDYGNHDFGDSGDSGDAGDSGDSGG